MFLNPPVSNREEAAQTLENKGFCVIDALAFSKLIGISSNDLTRFDQFWNDLKEDHFLNDHGKYRLRRHSSYVIENGSINLCPHRAHWQSVDFNALHGGIVRQFEPIDDLLNQQLLWNQLIAGISTFFQLKKENTPWYTEAHQFRINTTGGIGRPTPEGAHRDGVDFIAIILIKRHKIKGGETRLFNLNGNDGIRFTLDQPWSVLLLDDHKVIHETTPIQDAEQSGYRDTLVLTYRRNGFQDSHSSRSHLDLTSNRDDL
jgi:hypothetical protein